MNIESFPKIELHCHLDGSVRAHTLRELSGSTEDLDEQIHAPRDCDSLVTYLKCFALPIKLMQSSEALERIACELVEDVARCNVKYIEVRFAPQVHLEKGLTIAEAIESVLKGLQRGEAATGTWARLILCCMRHLPASRSLELVEAGAAYLGRGVVAVDLAGDEHHYPPELHQAAFDRAKALGYKITIHAGETGIGANVTKSIQLLHADRIGHGLYIMNDPAAYALVMERQIPLEMCPSSNVQTRGVLDFKAHPCLKFLRAGVQVTVNTDNMTVSDIDLCSELRAMKEQLGAGTEDLRQIYVNAVKASFATESEKIQLLKHLP